MSKLDEMEAASDVLTVDKITTDDTHFVVVSLFDLKTHKQIGRSATCTTTFDRDQMRAASMVAAQMITFPKDSTK